MSTTSRHPLRQIDPRPAPERPTEQPTLLATAPPESAATTSGLQRLLQLIWRDWRISVGVAVAAPVLYGVVAGWLTPRGPITTAEALTTMVVSLAVGVVAGLATRSRWAMLLAPAAFVAAFELIRLSVTGPIVDGLHLDSLYGWIAFGTGRGIHGLLAVPTMVLGAVLGAAWARRLSDDAVARHWLGEGGAVRARRAVTGLLVVAMLALAVGVARPATTDPILGSDGQPVPGSIAALARVEIGGHDLAVMIRGHGVDNPVLLFLAGGPGGTELGAMRRHLPALEQDFVVATYDQRGTGKSYGQLDPTLTHTVGGAVRDVLEMTNYLRAR
jgi:hypothetical protein